jgi:SAM-dependent methyltransferase
MRSTPELGLEAPEHGWVPSPTFAMRRAAVLQRLSAWAPGRALEVGCGAGALLHDLADRGFSAVGVESSPAARALATRLLAGRETISVTDTVPPELESFDYLLSFEVLEHIEDDAAALRDWVRRLKPGAPCLLSVPASSAKWSLMDEWAGHFRRYDRPDVERLVHDAGLALGRIETIGFPATWLIERVRLWARMAQLRARGVDAATFVHGDAKLTARSGIERDLETKLFPIYGSALGRRCFHWAARAQEHFADTDHGISYLVTAWK